MSRHIMTVALLAMGWAMGLALVPGVAAAQEFADPGIQRSLDALKLEPSIQQAQKSALEFFNIDPDTISSMRTRARLKSLLPQIAAKFRRNNNDVFASKLDQILLPGTRPAQEDTIAGTVTEFEVGASWSLPRLLFNPEVLDVSSLAVLQEGVLKEVTRLYYTRRRLQVDLILKPAKDPATKWSKELRIGELTATLDAMTGNLFSKNAKRQARVKRRRRPPTVTPEEVE